MPAPDLVRRSGEAALRDGERFVRYWRFFCTLFSVLWISNGAVDASATAVAATTAAAVLRGERLRDRLRLAEGAAAAAAAPLDAERLPPLRLRPDDEEPLDERELPFVVVALAR